MASRDEKKAATRKKLLDAAAVLVASQGALATSLDAIAAKAGLTKGAVYSNFASKEDLLYAMATIAAGPAVQGEFVETKPFGDQMEQLGRDLAKANHSVSNRAWRLGIEMYYLAVRNSRFRRLYAAHDRENRRLTGAMFDRVVTARGERTTLAGEELYTVANALAVGLSQARAIDPAVVPDELFAKAFRLLAA